MEHSNYQKYVDQFLRNPKDHKVPIMLFADNHYCSLLSKALKERDLKSYRYMITFTLDPSKYPDVTETILHSVEEFIEGQGRRQGLSIIHYAYVRESHQNGRPHWHASIITTKPLKKDRFNYYIKKYGNIDLSKSKSTNKWEALDYLSKSGTVKTIIA